MISLSGQGQIVFLCGFIGEVRQIAAGDLFNLFLNILGVVVERHVVVWVCSEDKSHVDLNSLQLCTVMLMLLCAKGVNHFRQAVGDVVASLVSLGQSDGCII